MGPVRRSPLGVTHGQVVRGSRLLAVRLDLQLGLHRAQPRIRR